MRLTKYIRNHILVLMLLASCQNPKTDLSKLPLTQKAEHVIHFSGNNKLGVERVCIPLDVVIETRKSDCYIFGNVELKEATINFQIRSNKFRTDTSLRNQYAQYDVTPFSNTEELNAMLLPFQSDGIIYGYQIEINTPALKVNLLNELIKLYGKGIKNPNTDNGLYWVIPKENKYIFFAADYDRLIVLNNTHLSKTCYWDNMNGTIDFGGCDKDAYLQGLMK
jgi:hypothetical protein